jgi:hypothetical protein
MTDLMMIICHLRVEMLSKYLLDQLFSFASLEYMIWHLVACICKISFAFFMIRRS